MNLEEATKKIRAEKPKENFLQIEISGSFVVPIKDGQTILAALNQAESAPNYYNDYRIGELKKDSISTVIITPQEYERHKIAALMNVSVDDIREAQKEAAKAQQQPTP
jgi:hypothetical protein